MEEIKTISIGPKFVDLTRRLAILVELFDAEVARFTADTSNASARRTCNTLHGDDLATVVFIRDASLAIRSVPM